MHLCRLLLNAAYFYQRLVEYISVGDELSTEQDVDPVGDLSGVTESTPMLWPATTNRSAEKAFADMEMHLQISLIKVGIQHLFQLYFADDHIFAAQRIARPCKA